jgi:hypothetical protein
VDENKIEEDEEVTANMEGIPQPGIAIMGDTVRIIKSNRRINKEPIIESEGIVTFSGMAKTYPSDSAPGYVAEVILYRLGNKPALGRMWLMNESMCKKMRPDFNIFLDNLWLTTNGSTRITRGMDRNYLESNSQQFVIKKEGIDNSCLQYQEITRIAGHINDDNKIRYLAKIIASAVSCNILMCSSYLMDEHMTPDISEAFTKDMTNLYNNMPANTTLKTMKNNGQGLWMGASQAAIKAYRSVQPGWMAAGMDNESITEWARSMGFLGRSQLQLLTKNITYLNIMMQLLIKNHVANMEYLAKRGSSISPSIMPMPSLGGRISAKPHTGLEKLAYNPQRYFTSDDYIASTDAPQSVMEVSSSVFLKSEANEDPDVITIEPHEEEEFDLDDDDNDNNDE